MKSGLLDNIAEIVPGVKELKRLTPGYDSTNAVFEVITDSAHFILKLGSEKVNSPFWQGLKLLFDSMPAKGAKLNNLTEKLNALNVFPIPKIIKHGVLTNFDRTPYVLVEKMAGEPVHQGSQFEQYFMTDAEIAHELGKFLGTVRQIQSTHPDTDFRLKLADTVLQLSKQEPALRNTEVQTNLNSMLERIRQMPLPEHIGLIMPDLWPSQFLLEKGKISALIDIESYVYGPLELELSVLELWLEDFDSLKKGYESTGQKFPDISATRDIYRFLLYLFHGCPEQGLNSLLTVKNKM